VNHQGHSEKTNEHDVDTLHSIGVGHEEGDINIGPVYKFMAWLAVLMIFTYLLVFGIMKWNDARIEKVNDVVTHIAKTKSEQLPAEPRLQLARNLNVQK
jgi:hypothetical protein